MSDCTQRLFEGFAACLPEPQASFAERGCAVPFTAPMLSGARLRRSAAAQAELLLPALGGRGVYVMDWDSCLAHCAPSLHDRQLWDRIARPERPTPALMRAAAREVARLGYAGRSAQAAAQLALRQQDAVREAVRDALAARFLPLGSDAPDAPDVADLLGPMVAILAQTGTGPGQLTDGDPFAAIPQAIVALEAFCASIAAWNQSAQPPQDRRAAAITLGAARMTLFAADGCLQSLWRMVADLPERLAAQEMRQAEVLPLMANLAARADWLLDGWAMIEALWAAASPPIAAPAGAPIAAPAGAPIADPACAPIADPACSPIADPACAPISAPAGRSAVLAELLSLLPVPPLEAETWPGARQEWDTLLRARRMVAPSPAWCHGRLEELAQRNEALRALAP